jgi:5-methylcytosine-specific restriction enzyme subunit McrC
MALPLENLYYLLAYAGSIDSPEPLAHRATERSDAPFDWLAQLLAQEVERLARRPLAREYAPHQAIRTNVAGRLHLLDSELRGLRVRGKLLCTSDEFTTDTPLHRVIASTIARLTVCPELVSKRRLQLRHTLRHFAGVDASPLGIGELHRLRLDGSTRRYRFAVDLCKLLIGALVPSRAAGTFAFPDYFASDQAFGRLFEAFLRGFYKRELGGHRSGRRRYAWDSVPHHPNLPALETDVTIEGPAGLLHLEAKSYGVTRVRGRFGERERVRSEHLAQLAAYLSNTPQNGKPVDGLLLYAVASRPAEPIVFNWRGAQVRVIEVNLDAPWSLLRDDLLRIVRETRALGELAEASV